MHTNDGRLQLQVLPVGWNDGPAPGHLDNRQAVSRCNRLAAAAIRAWPADVATEKRYRLRTSLSTKYTGSCSRAATNAISSVTIPRLA